MEIFYQYVITKHLNLSAVLRFFLIKLIKIYQKTISPDHGIFRLVFPFGYCRFRPTCSDYAIAAIEKYGVIKGGLKSCWRVLRCNPLGKGGWDPVK